MSQLKQLVLAMHEYADVKKTFPPNAIYDAEGKPLLSWRVAILPYIEEKQLYGQFHLDEPWDSPHNRELIAHMPPLYRNPNLSAGEGKTTYLAPVGKECIFDGTPQGLRFAQITDAASKTIILVEADADRAVEWTRPADWSFDPEHPSAGLGHARPGVWLAGWADGRAAVVSNDSDPQLVKSLFTRNGRKVIQLP
jgi:hypothetical protein